MGGLSASAVPSAASVRASSRQVYSCDRFSCVCVERGWLPFDSCVASVAYASDVIYISTNQKGDMQLKVETSIVSVKTYFKELQSPQWGMSVHPCRLRLLALVSSLPAALPRVYFVYLYSGFGRGLN